MNIEACINFNSYLCRQTDTCEWWRWHSTPPLPRAVPSASAAASAGSRCAGASWNGRVGWGSTWPWWSSYTGHSGSSTTRPPQRSRAAANAIVREREQENKRVSMGFLTNGIPNVIYKWINQLPIRTLLFNTKSTSFINTKLVSVCFCVLTRQRGDVGILWAGELDERSMSASTGRAWAGTYWEKCIDPFHSREVFRLWKGNSKHLPVSRMGC